MALDRLGSVAVTDLPAVLQFVLVHADSQLPQVRSSVCTLAQMRLAISPYTHISWHGARWCSSHTRR